MYKAFYKSKFFFLSYLLILAVVVAVNIYMGSLSVMQIDFVQAVIKWIPYIIYLFLLFASYEFFRLSQNDAVVEVLNSIPMATVKVYTRMAATLFTAAFSLFAVQAIAFVTFGIIKRTATPVILYSIESALINILFIACLAVLQGACFSFIKKRVGAYLAILLTVLLFTPLHEVAAMFTTSVIGVNSYSIYNCFNIFSPALSWATNFSFGLSVQSYRVELIGAWCCVFGAVLIYMLAVREHNSLKLKAVTVPMCVGFAVLFVLFSMPCSKFITDYNPKESINEPQDYYHAQLQNGTGKKEEADFSVTKYNLGIKIDRCMSVVARMDIDRPSLGEYKFTLFHGFKVKNVTDFSGEALEFSQQGDYLCVKGTGDVKGITVEYKGYSPQYYSNSQGVAMPGLMAYYPHAGYCVLYDNDLHSLKPMLLEKETDFTVNVECDKTVYCSLEQVGENSFEGKADSVTFYSGFLKETVVNGIRLVYPYQDSTMTSALINKVLGGSTFKENVGGGVKTVFVLPNLNQFSDYERLVEYSDHITTSCFNELENLLSVQRCPFDKAAFMNISLMSDKQFNEIIALMDKGEFYKNDIFYSVKKCRDKLGEEVCYEAFMQYIFDDSDTRTPDEFLADLLDDG